MKKKCLLIIIILSLLIILAGCNGQGNLKVVVYDQQQDLISDIYVGLYTSDFKHRVRFAYTIKGEADFYGLRSGIYAVRIVGNNIEKETKVRIQSQETNYIKVTLSK
ncbi:MAG: hypothetical protein AWU54_2215 [Candidatus Frackibacter sp. T328-2]|nr:MAG: hypothetical protein AWU54_2215 [Candidatus Frackibacter sp. T328-2]